TGGERQEDVSTLIVEHIIPPRRDLYGRNQTPELDKTADVKRKSRFIGEKIATKAPRHQAKPMVNIAFCVFVPWWRKFIP
ncbi:MAG: hypothetical protein JSW26_03415, partial [Desulfobacterales bacterium]